MILLVDNYDSFAHNLARYFERLGQPTVVRRNDAVSCDEIAEMQPAAIVLSPGPCTPTEAGVSLQIVQRFCGRLPILGVCLGHQTIAAALGAAIVRAPTPMHGRTSPVEHAQHPLFAGVPNPFPACRYHSLIVAEDTLPACLQPIAHASDGVLMALAHRTAPVYGVQFHPESILTDWGYVILANFLRLAGLAVTTEAWFAGEIALPPPPRVIPPSTTPVTF